MRMSEQVRIVILYEDSGYKGEFGLHRFVLTCLHDQIHERFSTWKLKKLVEGIPKKGDSKLLAACQHDLERMASRGQPVFAVFDGDKIRRLLGLESDACVPSIVDRFREQCGGLAPRLNVIHDNTETILHLIVDEMRGEIPERLIDRAINKKKTQDRDRIFERVSKRSARRIRSAVLEKCPSLKRLVDQCIRLLD